MPARSITDAEIGVIKTMLARGMKNKDIQFFFNRPNRPVNSGRISGIRAGAYPKGQSIAAADDAATDQFIKDFHAKNNPVVVQGVTTLKGPLSLEALEALFEEVGVGLAWRLKNGETDQHECKSGFGFKFSAKWLKAIAALANNKGGYVLFGVNDKGEKDDDGNDISYTVKGLVGKEFTSADPVEFTKRLKSTFDPTPSIATTHITVGGNVVGVIYVERHPSGPIIATRNQEELKEGDIYFRYPGQSTRIKYSDLRAILDGRDAAVRVQILPMVERLLSLGPQRAMVADLQSGALLDGKHVIQIDEALVEKIAFIKEGQFDEKVGSPALRLVGDVSRIAGGIASSAVNKGVITRTDLLREFLDQTQTVDPKECIRFAIEHLQGDWLPLRYFAKRAKLTRSELIAFINATGATADRKATFVRRLTKDLARVQAGGKAALLLKRIEAGDLPLPKTSKEAVELAGAIRGLPNATTVPLADLLRTLRASQERTIGGAASVVRRAMCRVDEIFFPL